MSETQFKPCPFCGDEHFGIMDMTYMHADGRRKGKRIKCNTCGAMAPDSAWNERFTHAMPKSEPVYLVIDHNTLWRQVGESHFNDTPDNQRMLVFTTPQPSTDVSELEKLQSEKASLEFKLKGASEISKCKDGEIKRLEQLLADERDKKFARFNNEECWIYQGDGQDYLDSLICPIVIKPDVLKALIAKHTVK